MRTGDTPADERRAFGRRPPDILVTTPESLYLLLTSQAREALRGVEWVIVDEIHALAGTKRGAHLALSLERLEALTDKPPQRIGLSATQRPLSVGRRLPRRPWRPATTARRRGRSRSSMPACASRSSSRSSCRSRTWPPSARYCPIEQQPGGSAAAPDARSSIWPQIHPAILELIRAHRSTIVFVNCRRLAERLAQRLNELAGEELVTRPPRLARARAAAADRGGAQGRPAARRWWPRLSLELGIDMGAVDLVIQVESPGSVARGLQRIGRAGHQVGEPSQGVIFPKYRGDLLECAVVTRGDASTARSSRPSSRATRSTCWPSSSWRRPPSGSWPVDELYALVRRAENFADLGRDSFEAALGMLAGHYPARRVRRAAAARRLGPHGGHGREPARRADGGRHQRRHDPGSRPVRRLPATATRRRRPGRARRARAARGGGRRVGELDEEMVYEAREGEVILLGASAWRIEQITHDRVLVSPAPGRAGQDAVLEGRWPGPADRARPRAGRVHARDRRGGGRGPARPGKRPRSGCATTTTSTSWPRSNLLDYLAEERESTGALPTDRTIVLQRFRDELGDWRICLLTPFGARVHAPWALAIEARLRERLGLDVQPIWSDDGIVVRLPDDRRRSAATDWPSGDGGWPCDVGRGRGRRPHRLRGGRGAGRRRAGRLGAVRQPLPRERGAGAAAAAPARRPAHAAVADAPALGAAAGRGQPLRLVPDHPRDVPRVPAGRVRPARAAGHPGRASSGARSALVSVETRRASPFASSLMFDYIASYMYEGDAPLADRRAQALALDRDLLRELLGAEELRELLDADALAELELELQSLTPERAAGSAEPGARPAAPAGRPDAPTRSPRGCAGPTSERATRAAGEWLEALAADRRAVQVRHRRRASAGSPSRTWPATATRVGVAPPIGVPQAFLAPVAGCAARAARALGAASRPVPGRRAGGALGRAGCATSRRSWSALLADGHAAARRVPARRRRARVVPPGGAAPAAPPLAGPAAARDRAGRAGGAGALPAAWQGVGAARGGIDRLAEVIAQLEGLPLPASVLERDVLPARVRGYSPRLLDELGAAGEVVWIGAGALGQRRRPRRRCTGPTGCRCCCRRRRAGRARRSRRWLHDALREHLAESRRLVLPRPAGGRRCAPQPRAASERRRERELLDALWDLVWAGEVTNDTFAPLRALRWPRTDRRRRTAAAAPALPRRQPAGPARGRRPLVAGHATPSRPRSRCAAARTPTDTERRHALALRLLERHGVVTRDAVAAESVAGGFARRLSGPARDGGARPRPPRLLRRGPGWRAVLPAGRARPAARERGDPGGDDGPTRRARAGRRRPGQPVRRRAALAAPRRRGPPAVASGPPAPTSCWSTASPSLYLERGGKSLQTLPAQRRRGATQAALAGLSELRRRRPLPVAPARARRRRTYRSVAGCAT